MPFLYARFPSVGSENEREAEVDSNTEERDFDQSDQVAASSTEVAEEIHFLFSNLLQHFESWHVFVNHISNAS